MNIRKVKTKFENSYDYIYGEKWIFKEVKGSNEKQFVCKSLKTKFRCRATLRKNDDDNGYTGDDSLHNHPEPKLDKKTEPEKAKKRPASNTIDSKNKTIKKAVPKDLKQFKSALSSNQLIKNVFRAQVTAVDGSTACILSTKNCYDRLGEFEEVYLHATYKVHLSDIDISQILIFFGRRNNIGIPCLFVLTDSTTKPLYSKLWQDLILRVPAVRENLKRVVTDCYLPLITSVKDILPHIKVKGSFLNYIRMAAREWKTCSLDNVRHEILKWVFLLPTLPSDQFHNGIVEINQRMIDNKDVYEEPLKYLAQFMTFIQKWWEPVSQKISFANNINDSINISEYFDRHIGSEFSSLSPDIFRFSESVKRICNKSEEMLKAMEKGAKFELYEKQSFIKINNHISQKLNLLSCGKISLVEYFQQAMTNDMHELILKILEAPQYINDTGRLDDFQIN